MVHPFATVTTYLAIVIVVVLLIASYWPRRKT